MAVYVISDVRVRDADGFRAYTRAVPSVLAKHGVEYVVRGGDPTPLEGQWDASRMVVLRFRDRAHVRDWYESPEYQELVALRAGSAEVSAVVVDGFDPAPAEGDGGRPA
jgi:uncharacterized protein (DUF1330 family)